MTNRKLSYVVKDQAPLVLSASDTVRRAAAAMWERRAGSALVVDERQRLVGIFTGRDAVRLLAKAKDAGGTALSKAMTRSPVTVAPENRAVDALRCMCQGNFRHVPVVEDGKIWGVVSRGDFKGMEFESLRWCEHGCLSPPNRRLADIVASQKPVMHAVDDTVRQACQSMWKRKSGSALVIDKRDQLAGIFTGRDAVRLLGKAKDPAGTLLARAMTRRPATIAPDLCAIDALRAMSDGGFRHLPVVADGKILGVVSRSDFTGCEIDRLEEEEHLYECLR